MWIRSNAKPCLGALAPKGAFVLNKKAPKGANLPLFAPLSESRASHT